MFEGLRTAAGFPPVDLNAIIPWEINIIAFAGSFQDDGVGEDFVPNNAPFVTVRFPCQAFDACDVCGGDGSSCADCARIPNGPNRYDACDVCGGNGQTCRDCRGVVFGTATYDACDVCGGDGSSCLDCRRVLFGTSRYDVCDVCGGDGTTCLDCARMPFGRSVYDVCDVCGGNGSTCRDCRGIANGPNRYDSCDVCAGDGTSCFDCRGVVFGTTQYDACDVCGGDGLSCVEVPPERDPCLARFETKAVCELFPGDVFLTTLRSDVRGGRLAGKNVALTVGERGMMILESSIGQVFQRWLVDAPTQHDIQIFDLASFPADSACPASQSGSYSYKWSKDCMTLVVTQVADRCAKRESLMRTNADALHFVRQTCRAYPERQHDCQLRAGTQWFGRYASGEWSSLVVGNGAFVHSVSGADQHYFGQLKSGEKTLNIVDVGSAPPALTCMVDDRAAQYT